MNGTLFNMSKKDAKIKEQTDEPNLNTGVLALQANQFSDISMIFP